MPAPTDVRRVANTRTDWETPWPLFEKLDQEFRFTLDAAADEYNRKCERWLEGPCDGTDACGCGLCADIFDQVVWCNPPYGKGLEAWVAAFARWSLNGCTVVALLPANTDTRWFRSVYLFAHEIRLLHGRVNFEGSNGGNTGGSLIAVYYPQPLRIRDGTPSGTPPGKPLVTVQRFVPPRIWLWDWRNE